MRAVFSISFLALAIVSTACSVQVDSGSGGTPGGGGTPTPPAFHKFTGKTYNHTGSNGCYAEIQAAVSGAYMLLQENGSCARIQNDAVEFDCINNNCTSVGIHKDLYRVFLQQNYFRLDSYSAATGQWQAFVFRPK